MALTVVATYDVRQDDRRARLAALLQAYGNRIQKSVFVLEVDDDELAGIVNRTKAIVNLDSDSVWFARQCANCWDDLITLGQTEPPRQVLYWAVV